MKLNPDIVFVEKSVSREILTYFAEKGISVICGLKKKELQKIVRLTGIRKTIKNIWNANRYNPHHLLGTLDLMYLKKFDHYNQSLLYLERNIGIYSIVIS